MEKALVIGLLMTLLSDSALALSISNKTDLRDNGNSYVLEQHRAFLKKNKTCSPKSDASFRVVLQGFSLFSGVDMNISGAVVDSFNELPLDQRSLISADDFGSRVSQKTIEINGHKIELCTVVSEVLWDLAAVNLIKVIDDFKPDFVLMSGRGGKNATIETGGRNQASSMSGYSYNGHNAGPLNRPSSRRVDPRFKSNKVIPSTWNYEDIQSKIEPLIKELDHKLVLGKEGRKDNDYICNNIHYSILQAATEGNIELAGGLLRPMLDLEVIPAIGFFHYPSKSLDGNREAQLGSWVKVIKELIRAQLNL